MFVASPLHAQMLGNAAHAPCPDRVVVSGSPRLEAWYKLIESTTASSANPGRKKEVVWAPHHSLSARSLRLGTFDWSGPAMLALAQANPWMQFTLRPHPNLWHQLERAKRGAAKEFLAAWSALANTALSEGGDALPVLSQADALVTDSASFLAEFMMTGRPILRLTRPDGVALSAFGLTLAPGFYHCSNETDLNGHFNRVIVKDHDPLRSVRRHLASKLSAIAEGHATLRIRDEILRALTD